MAAEPAPPAGMPVIGHASWARQATAAALPPGLSLAREERRLGVAAYIDLVRRSGPNRPVAEEARVAAMLEHANLLLTAREGARGSAG